MPGSTEQSLVVSVADTGIGIAPEHFGRLGDPFFQVRGSYARSHDGSGLGLSIVKGLARLHGGEVEVRSRVGEGTRVTVRLPLDCERRPCAGAGAQDRAAWGCSMIRPSPSYAAAAARPLQGFPEEKCVKKMSVLRGIAGFCKDARCSGGGCRRCSDCW